MEMKTPLVTFLDLDTYLLRLRRKCRADNSNMGSPGSWFGRESGNPAGDEAVDDPRARFIFKCAAVRIHPLVSISHPLYIGGDITLSSSLV